MALIDISRLTFGYEGSFDNIFEEVSFQIDTDWKLGFVGRNGRGKTTFLKLLLGEYEYRGRISSPVRCCYFPFPVADESRTGLEAACGVDQDIQLWRLERELSLLDTDPEVLGRALNTLSPGERTKVLLAALFARENSFLLIDEPTNHLDMAGRQVVSSYLQAKKGFILVSHDRAFLDGCVDHILSINKANIEIQQGNFSSWLHNKELRDSFELAENAKLKREVKRLEQTAREKAAWSERAEGRKIGFDPAKTEKDIRRRSHEGAKAKKLMGRAKAIEERQQSALAEKSRLLKNIESADPIKLAPQAYHQPKLAELRDAALYYGPRQVAGNISLTVERGDRVALRGPNGCGKSTLLKLIEGQDIAYSGYFWRGSQLLISYAAQDAASLQGRLEDYARFCGVEESLFKAILRQLDFSRSQFDKDMGDYSAGQKKKVLLARSLCQRAHLYIWDEPLNYIDVISRMQIEELLLKYQPTLIFVEHDQAFCEKIATKTLFM